MAIVPQSRGGFQSKDVSGLDLSSHNFATAGTGGVRITFEWINVEITTVDPELNGAFQPRLAAFKQPLGDRRTVATELLTPEEASRKYPQEYAMFSQYEETPSNGTPLREVPGLAQSQIGLFSLHGLRSAEDVASLSDSQVSELGISAKKAAKIITAWLAKRNDERDMIEAAELQAKHDAEKRAMEDRIARLEKANMALQADQRVQGGQQPVTAPQAGAYSAVQHVADDELPDGDLANAPNALIDGPGRTDGNDDMANGDPDPLRDE